MRFMVCAGWSCGMGRGIDSGHGGVATGVNSLGMEGPDPSAHAHRFLDRGYVNRDRVLQLVRIATSHENRDGDRPLTGGLQHHPVPLSQKSIWWAILKTMAWLFRLNNPLTLSSRDGHRIHLTVRGLTGTVRLDRAGR